MMWDDSVEIGCGMVKTNDAHYIVCQYAPTGNIPNENTAHVHPAKTGINMRDHLNALEPYVKEQRTHIILYLRMFRSVTSKFRYLIN